MQLQIENQDGDAVIRLPAAVLQQLGAGIGDSLHIQVTSRGLTLSRRPPRPYYTLEELLLQGHPSGDQEHV